MAADVSMRNKWLSMPSLCADGYKATATCTHPLSIGCYLLVKVAHKIFNGVPW